MTDRAEHLGYQGGEPQFERPAAENPPFKYRAFLSYSHRDTKWAKWLHGALEGYRIDKDLVGRKTVHGLVPKTLRPIFRDREDFSAGHSLTEQTLGALEASQFLIVLCSPHAAQSKYVDEEIRYFKSLGRTHRVIAIIVDGEPGGPQRDCFPPAARFKLDANGKLTDEREEPIAADARPQGDGKEIAKQKIVAGLLGVALDEILRRAECAIKRRNRIRIAVASIATALVLGGTAGWWGALSVTSRLDTAEILNLARDAADVCDRARSSTEARDLSEAQRIVLAAKCVDVMSEGLEGLPADTPLPQKLTESFEANLSILRTAREHGSSSSDQMELLARGEMLALRFGIH